MRAHEHRPAIMDQTTPRRPRGRPRKHTRDADVGTVQTLTRGLEVLSLLAREQRVTLTNLALQIGMPPSTAHRLLMTLQSRGFADFDEGSQEWMVGVEAFRVGSGFVQRVNLVEASHEIMHRLVGETGETANLAIADDGDVVFISQVETPNPIRAFFRPGTRSHMHASGAGKALLAQRSQEDVERILQRKGLPEFTGKTLTRPELLFADLDETRTRGWAFDNEERYEGMCCIASAVFNSDRDAVAGISVSGPSARFTDRSIAEFGTAVLRAAADLTARLGGSV